MTKKILRFRIINSKIIQIMKNSVRAIIPLMISSQAFPKDTPFLTSEVQGSLKGTELPLKTLYLWLLMIYPSSPAFLWIKFSAFGACQNGRANYLTVKEFACYLMKLFKLLIN